jgi:hypothetical protein
MTARRLLAILVLSAVAAGYGLALPANACDKTSTTQISVQGNPANPCKVMREFDPIEIEHTIYYCTGDDFNCKSVTITLTLSNPDKDKTQKDLAKEIEAELKDKLKDFEGKIEAVDNMVTLTGTNSCSGTGDPATPDNPEVQPPGSSKTTPHTSQQTFTP